MVSDNQIIYKIDVDTSDLIPELAKATKALEVAREKQQELSTTTVEGTKVSNKASEEYQRAAAETRRLADEARMLQRQIDANNKVLKANISTTQIQTNSVNENRKVLSALTANYNQLKVGVDLTQKEYDEFAAKIKEVSDRLKEQEGNVGNTSRNVGNYAEAIANAIPGLGQFSQGLAGFQSSLTQINDSIVAQGGANKLLAEGLNSARAGFLSLTKASLAFIATPIGAVLAVIVGAVLLVKNALDRSADSTAKLSKITGAFSGVLNGLLSALQPVGEFLIDGLVKGFELAVTAVEKGVNAISKGLEFLGLVSAANGLNEFTQGVKNAAQAGIEFANEQAKLDKMQREARATQLKFQKEAEKFRQIRDDSETRSIKERIQANEDLGKTLKKQAQEELAIATQAFKVAQLRIKQTGETKDSLDKLAEARTNIIDIEERITGQESEQLLNRNSLIREGNVLFKQSADERAKIRQQEAEARKKEAEQIAKDLKESQDRERQQLERELQIIKELQDTTRQATLIAIEKDFETRERLLRENFTTQEKFDEDLKQLQLERINAELDALIILQSEKDLILEKELERDNFLTEQKIENIKKQTEAEKQAQAEQVALAQEFANKRIEIGNNVAAILEGIATGQIQSAEDLQRALLNLVLDTIEKELVALQAKIIAEQVALGLSSLNPAIIAKAVLSQIAIKGAFTFAKSQINQQRFAKGGILEGSSHAQGGIKLLDKGRIVGEVEGGEPILTKNITKNKTRMKFISQWNQEAGGAPLFEGGGILPSVTDGDNQTIVISVQEITRVQNRVKYLERSGRF